MYMCATHFDLEEEGLDSARQFRSTQDKEIREEERDAENPEDWLDPISDNEEDDLSRGQCEPGIMSEITTQRSYGQLRVDSTAQSGEDRGTGIDIDHSSDSDEDYDTLALPQCLLKAI
jgi:hypothetical protein